MRKIKYNFKSFPDVVHFKVGDLVRCKPGFTNNYNEGKFAGSRIGLYKNRVGGMGYSSGDIIKVARVEAHPYADIIFPEYGNGVYDFALELIKD